MNHRDTEDTEKKVIINNKVARRVISIDLIQK